MDTLNKTKTPRKFIWVTQDWSGLGFMNHFSEEDNEVIVATKMKDTEDNEECFNMVGFGIVKKMDLDDLMVNRRKYTDWYWIWDSNHNPEYSDKLRSEGFKVLGGSSLMYKMEHDRQFGQDLVKQAGLNTPPTHEFKTIKDGLKFLEENEDKSYVFKPDAGDGCWKTYVPDNEDDECANEELYRYMESQPDDGTTYILQERIKGLECNVEIWVYKGQPFFAHANLESKRKLNKDEGEMVGCSQDIKFVVPLETKIVQDTVIKFLKVVPDYTGFLDMNILIKDKKNYFLEFCARFSYNSHPNLFWNLAMKPQSDIMADFIDGKIDNFYDNFRDGFGASITLYIDHIVKGMPFEKEDYLVGHFYHFDSYMEEDEYKLAGYFNEVGVVCAYGYTIKDAAEECLRLANKIHYPNHAMRSDLDKNDYISAPIGRYEALKNMGYLDTMNSDGLYNNLYDKLYSELFE